MPDYLAHVDLDALRRIYFERKSLKICIAGGPRTGKTTLALDLACALWSSTEGVRSTDELQGLPWAEQALSAADVIRDGTRCVVEGVTIARGLRSLVRENPEHLWCNILFVMEGFKAAVTPGQQSMTKGVITVLRSVLPILQRAGTQVLFLP